MRGYLGKAQSKGSHRHFKKSSSGRPFSMHAKASSTYGQDLGGYRGVRLVSSLTHLPSYMLHFLFMVKRGGGERDGDADGEGEENGGGGEGTGMERLGVVMEMEDRGEVCTGERSEGM